MTTKAELAKEILLMTLVEFHVSIKQQNGWGETFYRSGKISAESAGEIGKVFKTYYTVLFEDELEAKNKKIAELEEIIKNKNNNE